MRLVCCILASLLAACSDAGTTPAKPAPESSAYFQDYVVAAEPPGFRLEKQIEPARADPKRFYWRATYDREGRIVRLETFAYPMCLQSQLNLTYAEKQAAPAKRQRLSASNCQLAKGL
jgi:soluble lytic murein transglycosylase-like protein